jgi:hypothetical protein
MNRAKCFALNLKLTAFRQSGRDKMDSHKEESVNIKRPDEDSGPFI